MISKKILMPILLTLVFSFKSILCEETSLVNLSTRFLKSLPEFIGYDIKKGMTNEMKAYYKSCIDWNLNPFTLKSNELAMAFDAFILGFSYDSSFNEASRWVKKISPPSSLFDTSKAPQEIAYPYIQKVIVPEGSTILFMGDVHASFHSLLRILWRWRLLGFMDSEFNLKKNYYVVITGDYVDYGNGGSELWYLLVVLKLHNWNHVFMLRGNHEFWSFEVEGMWTYSTFVNELIYKFGDMETEKLKNKIMCVYNLLPYTLLIGTRENYIVCEHGRVDATYNARNLMQVGNFYDYLSAVHNFAYDGAAHGGVTNNTCVDGLYSNDPTTKPIVTDINSLKTQYSIGNKRTRLIFRGHQHGNMPECFCFIKNGYPVGTNPTTTLLPGWQTLNNVSTKDQRDIANGTFKLDNPDYYPIYTLFSAMGNTTRYDCFASVTTAAKFSDWRFKLYQKNLDSTQQFLRNFARLELYNKNDIRTIYSEDNKPFKEPLSEDLKKL